MADFTSAAQFVGRPQVQLEDPMQAQMKAASLAQAMQQQQLGALQLGEAKRAAENRDYLQTAIQQGMDPYQAMMNRGMVKEAKDFQIANWNQRKAAHDAQKSALELVAQQTGRLAQITSGVKDQATFDQALAQAKKEGFNIEGINPVYNPDTVQQFQNESLSTKDRAELGLKKLEIDRKANENKWEGAKALTSYREATGNPNAQMTDPNFLKWYGKFKAAGGVEVKVATGGMNDISPEALDVEARNYIQTGQLGNYGMGSAGAEIRKKVMNRAAQIRKDEGTTLSPAEAKAQYQSDSSSLKALQKQYDAVTSFENTASKNLDIAIGLAKKLQDTGSPFLNQPFRKISKSALGSEDQAAFEAALRVANTEIAKVNTNPNLTGVLSDTARHEIDSISSPNATLGQLLSVAKVLKQDMSNRKTSMADTIKTVQGRISGKSSQPSAPKQNYEGEVSPSGAYIFRGGQWVPNK